MRVRPASPVPGVGFEPTRCCHPGGGKFSATFVRGPSGCSGVHRVGAIVRPCPLNPVTRAPVLCTIRAQGRTEAHWVDNCDPAMATSAMTSIGAFAIPSAFACPRHWQRQVPARTVRQWRRSPELRPSSSLISGRMARRSDGGRGPCNSISRLGDCSYAKPGPSRCGGTAPETRSVPERIRLVAE